MTRFEQILVVTEKNKVRREISGGAFVFRKPGCCILLLLEKNRSQRSFVLIGIRDLRKKICFGLHRQTLSVFSISRLSTIFFSLKSSFSLSLLVAERGFFLSLLKNKTTCFGSNLTKKSLFSRSRCCPQEVKFRAPVEQDRDRKSSPDQIVFLSGGAEI